MANEIKAAHIQGRYGIIAAVIGLIAVIVSSYLTYYFSTRSVKQENNELRQENASLVADSKAYVEQVQENDSEYQTKIDGLKAQITEYQNQLENSEMKKTQAENVTEHTEETENIDDTEWIDFIQAFDPYEDKYYWETDQVTMMGNTYRGAVKIHFDTDGKAWFNLDKKYTTLEFDIGHVDGSALSSASFTIRADDEFLQEVNLTPGMDITHISLPVNNVKKLFFSWGHYSYSPEYALINMKIR